MSGARAVRVAAALSFTLVVFAPAPRAERPLEMLRPPIAAPEVACGTSLERDVRAPRPYAVTRPKDGELLSFEQDPALVPADYAGAIVFRNFEVIGDYERLEFRPADPASASAIWRRVTTRSVNGRLVSVFEPAWNGRALDAAMAYSAFGFDSPGLYWGSIASPASGATTYIYLRMALGGIPESQVVRVNDRVQYASNVVNLVVRGFGDARVTGGVRAFELNEAADLFYQYFADQYDVLAFVPQATPASDYGAFHRNVQNHVMGINLPLLDQAASYGSAGVLQGVEVYTGITAARYAETNHEMAHQWGSSFDWTRIAGITRAGHEPSAHAPLWTGGETPLSAVLAGTRRVHASAAGYDIERTPAVGFHPLDLYAMGVLPENQVPDFGVFVDQSQLDVMVPDIGRRLVGPARRVTIADIVREHGIREGPVPTRWRRATVLVSRDRLASQQEMDYWNFFAERLADPDRRGTPTADGYVPFRVASRGAVILSTAIVARRGAALPQVIDTDAPAFGGADWRAVSFAPAVPSRFAAGDGLQMTGRVAAADAADFDRIVLSFWNDSGAEPITFAGDVGRNGDFTVPVRFSHEQRGRYLMSVYLFWEHSGPQRPRASVSSIAVD